MCLTVFGQETNATHLVSKSIGNAEARSRAKHTAAGIRHRHLEEHRSRGDIANAAIRLGHETPNIQCTHGGRALPSSKSGLVPRDACLVSDRPLRDADYPSTNVGYFTCKRNDAGSH